jgi:hypothetical protein
VSLQLSGEPGEPSNAAGMATSRGGR